MALFRSSKKTAPAPARRRYTYAATGAGSRKDRQERDRKIVQYKRGRTMAGSTQSRLRSSESTALQAATPREKAHHLANVRRKIISILGFVGGISIVLLVLLWQFSADVFVQLPGRSSQEITAKYEATIQDYLQENPSERLRFNLDQDRLTDYMNRSHPEVKTVEQNGYVSFATTSFMVSPRTPVASWQVGNSQYFVDSQGVSFTNNLHQPPPVTIVDNSGVRHTPGTAIASERFLGFVGRTVALAHKNGLNITDVSIPAGTSRQVELAVEGVGYPIIVSIDRSPAEQVEDALRAVQHFKVTGKSPKYIDLRVKGRSFFRE